jgi:outer membrane protein
MIIAEKLRSEFLNRAKELQKEDKILSERFKKFSKNSSKFSKSKFAKDKKRLVHDRAEITTEFKNLQRDSVRRQLEERNKVLNRIGVAVEEVAKRQGYDIVIDRRSIAYSNAVHNITADVFKRVR